MLRSRAILSLLALSAALLASCSAGSGRTGADPRAGAEARNAVPLVAVSILPQAEFVRRIAGDRFRVIVLVGPGQSPHSYEPSPRQLAELGRAAVWFTLGLEFEHALESRITALYPGLRVVDISAGIQRRPLEAHSDEAGAEGDSHPDEGLDPHTWLGRDEAKAELSRIRETLADIDPAGAALFTANHGRFVAEIDGVFEGLARDLAPLAGSPVFVYHPAFGYFLDEFGIIQEAVETGGKEPTQKHLAELVGRARAEGAKLIFVQAQFPTAAASSLAKAIGGVVQPLDDLAPDWLANIGRMGEALRKTLR
jgi:zinc transport system substrate-binding protein